jgi:hypothetical protein
MQPHEHVWERFTIFCSASSLAVDSASSVLILTRQIQDSGLRPGTILAYVVAAAAKFSRATRQCLRTWKKKLGEKTYALVKYKEEPLSQHLTTFVSELDQLDPSWRCLVCMLVATGPVDVFYLRGTGVHFSPASISFWRRRKRQISRSEIYDATYLFSWSLPPTPDVIDMATQTSGLLFTTIQKQEQHAAAHVNNRLERYLDGATSTSFRRRMENVLCASAVPIPDRERPIDHRDRIGEAHYCRNLARHQKSKRVIAHDERTRTTKRR